MFDTCKALAPRLSKGRILHPFYVSVLAELFKVAL
jgi:hypothetical protein